MGWWGCGVLDGDSPLDVLDAFADKLGLSSETSLGMYPLPGMPTEVATLVRDALTDVDLAVLRNELASSDDSAWGVESRAVCTQVVGAIVMAVGAPLGAFRSEVIAAANADPAWATDGSDERTAAMAALAAAAKSYSGTPVASSGTTLFDKVFGDAAST